VLDRGSSTETDAAAAREIAGERREGAVVHQRVNGWVGQLQGDDVVLLRVMWWLGSTCNELPTVRPRAAADGDRRRRGFNRNWRTTSGRGAPVDYG
jgi:hypothetical protein